MFNISLKEARSLKSTHRLFKQNSKFYEIRIPKITLSRSFDLPQISLLSTNQQPRPQVKTKTSLLIPTQTFQRNSARRSSRTEKVDLADVVSTTSHVVPETPKKKQNIRRASQYEYISSKQKRLNNIAPHLQVYQHSKDAAIIKKKKMNRLKMQYKFAQRANQKKHFRSNRSKSVPPPRIVKITHKRSKTVCEQQYQGPILKLEYELEKRIQTLIYQKRSSKLILRRKTCIQEPKNSIFVSRDKLLRYQEVMARKFDQFDNSLENSPIAISKLQLKKTSQFNKLQTIADAGLDQFLTPRLSHDHTLHIQARKQSHSVIAQYVIDKNKTNQKNNNVYGSKLPSIHQPSLKELNQYFLAQKRSLDIGKVQLELQQSKSQEMFKQLQLNNRQSQFLNKQMKIVQQQSKQDTITSYNTSTRIKTLPSDSTTSRNKINLQQRLWPYFQ